MQRIDQNEGFLTHISSEPKTNFFSDPKITMVPIVFTKKLDEMDCINTNWELLSSKKITTMLLEESKPKYNRSNRSTSTVKNMKSYNKLENKLKTYFQSTTSHYEELNLKRIIEMALNNIRTSTVNQKVQKENSRSPITVKNERESWSSDDDEALVSVIRRKIDTPKDIDSQKKTENKASDKPQKKTKSIAQILIEKPIKTIDEFIKMKNDKAPNKPKKAMTTVAEVQSQLKDFVINAPIKNAKSVAKIDDKVLVKVKRRNKPSKDVENGSQKKNQTEVPINTKIKKDTVTNIIENQSQMENQTKAPAKQNENKSPVALTNSVQNTKKKIRNHVIGGMSIYFFNTGLMAKQQKVTEERYDIGKDGTLEKFYVQSQPSRDFRRFSIEKTICCLYKRAQVITEILDEYNISPTAINFLRAAHLCEVGACLCCCKPNRSAPQSDAALTSRVHDRNVGRSSNAHASSPGTAFQNQNVYHHVYATDKIMKNISAHYKLSLALKGLITSLITNFKGITLTAGSTGKLSAVFNTTFTSWNNTDLQLMTTILTKMRRELSSSQIPPKAFCDCVNEALNKDNVYSQASSLLGSKQVIVTKQYSIAHFSVENKIIKSEDPNIEYFRGDLKLLQTPSNPGPSRVLNHENEENESGSKRKTIRNDEGEKDEPRKKPKRGPKISTKRGMRNKSLEDLRECVFVPESTPEEPAVPNNYDNAVPVKNPILQQMLAISAPESASPDFGVTEIPLPFIVSAPVAELNNAEVPLNHNPQTDNIVTIDLSSDEESILP